MEEGGGGRVVACDEGVMRGRKWNCPAITVDEGGATKVSGCDEEGVMRRAPCHHPAAGLMRVWRRYDGDMDVMRL